MKFKNLSGPGTKSTDCALAYFRDVAKETDNALARTLARGREFICDANRFLFSPFAPSVKGSQPTKLSPGGVKHTVGVICA